MSEASQTPRRRRRPSARALAKRRGQVDVQAILSEPVEVLKAGVSTRMDPLEAAVRAQVAKALNKQDVRSIMAVIDLALKYDLVVQQKKDEGGVLIIPKTLSRKMQEYIFSDPGPSMDEVIEIIMKHHLEGYEAGP